MIHCCFQPVLNQPLTKTLNALDRTIKGIGNVCVFPGWTLWPLVSLKQNTGMPPFVCRHTFGFDDVLESRVFFTCQFNNIFFHVGLLAGLRD